MRWLEIRVRADGEAAEAVSELFNRYTTRPDGTSNTVIEADGYDALGELADSSVVIKTYIPLDEQADEIKRQIEEGLWHLSQLYPIPQPEFRELTEEDWHQAWKAQFQPLKVGSRLVIKPSWHDWLPTPDEVVIELDPGMAFGTGLHPTTRLCLELLERYIRPGMRVLDQGSGSGILSLAAAKLGAAHVHARDIDPAAVRATRENAERNGLSERIRVTMGATPPEGQYDLILCNILADVIIKLLEQGLTARLAPGGVLLVSGILTTQVDEIVAAITAQGLRICERREEGDWAALAASAPK
ncbi:MAG TPA: 50S ribosomal protein L11 methyltransferase [Caldilineae bacterium]|nr:50S ribosomal protein L11 methyltransferase [Caldilineae bacterium]